MKNELKIPLLENRLKILFLPRWYPNRYDPMPGLFIQRQAEAVSAYCDVAVLYVHAHDHAPNRYEIDFAEENGIRVVRVYYREPHRWLLPGLLKLFRFFHAHRLGFKILRSFQPDLLHVHVLTREGIVARITRFLKGTPYVITEHWSRYLPASNTYKGGFRKWITRYVVKSAAAMITVSGTLKAAMKDFQLDNPDFFVVPNPVDTNLFTIGVRPSESDTKRFIHISCFEDRPKNISGFLNAVDNLSKKRSDFKCFLIGDGPEFSLWKNRANELGLLGNTVFFTGLKEQNELVKEIQAAGFLVLSSNYETFGTVVIECLACGIPVVATSTGIVPEVISGTNGIIVPAGDDKALEDAINKMLDKFSSYDPQVIRNTVLHKFDNETIAKQLLDIYQNALGSYQKKITHQFSNSPSDQLC
jgi:glycosyltransferase involved in cell wall biosynthesis